MTVCHAEEMNGITEESEQTFQKCKMKPWPGYALTPITKMKIKGYDDVKISLVGVIDNKEFSELLKANFMKSFVYEMKELLHKKPGFKFHKIVKNEDSNKYSSKIRSYYWESFTNQIEGVLLSYPDSYTSLKRNEPKREIKTRNKVEI